MNQSLSLGYSTCPNDTFVFHAMTHGKIDTHDLNFEVAHHDVEKLNQMACQKTLDISKLSFAALGHLHDDYGLLRCGAALGRGCGPMIVARPGYDLADIANHPVAVPGLWTTAALLLNMYVKKQLPTVPMVFDKIMPRVSTGKFNYGVIIHEGRFTYASHGLTALLDLGQWWEDETGLPIPLGCIAMRRSLGLSLAKRVDEVIAASIAYAFDHPQDSRNYVKMHAQEMDDEVMGQHITLYVNAQTRTLDSEGETAIRHLLHQAQQVGLIPERKQPIFAYE